MSQRWRFRLAATVALPFVALSQPGSAQPIDLSAATCADFVQMTPDDRGPLSLWLAGYFAGASQQPLLDAERLIAAPAELSTLCDKSPALRLLGAEVRAVFSGKPAP